MKLDTNVSHSRAGSRDCCDRHAASSASVAKSLQRRGLRFITTSSGVLAVAPGRFFPFVSDMQGTLPPAPAVELHAALLQAAITAGLALLCGFLFSRYRKQYFGWWAIA